MPRQTRIWTLIGETSREVGILVLVFGPLESFFSALDRGALIALSTTVLGVILIACGIILESQQ
jgi:hypothetical protein